MRLIGFVAVLLAVGTGAVHGAEPPKPLRSVRDALGAQIQVAVPPLRIVTLAPSLGELAADLLDVEAARIVGVSEYTDYPPRLSKVERVGPYHLVNLEKIARMKPDLVLATTDGNSKDQIQHLRELKIPVFVVETSSFAQVLESITLVGQVLGVSERAARMREQLANGIQRIKAKSASVGRPTVMLQVGDEPLVVVGKESFLNEALEAVGGKNIFEDVKGRYPRPALEEVLSRNPDVIVVLALDPRPELPARMAAQWKTFGHLKAVKANRVKVLHADSLLRPSLRLLEGLSLLQRTLTL